MAAGPHVPAAPALSWNAETGLLACRGGEAVLTLPRDLRAHLRAGENEATILPPGGRGGLLMTVSRLPAGQEGADVLGDLPRLWTDLHGRVTGGDLRQGQMGAEAHVTKRGRFVARYFQDPVAPTPAAASPPPQPTEYHASGLDIEEPRDTFWSLVYVEAGRCRIAAIDRAERDDHPRFGPLLDTVYVPPTLAP